MKDHPVISTNIHGIPYTIKNGENGLLVEPENYHSLANAILEFLYDEEKCVKFGLAGYELVINDCNSKIMAEKTLKIYQEVVNR